VPLGKVTFEGLSQWAARLHLGGLGPSGVRQSVFVMSAVLDHAVRSNRIRSNPARGLGLPQPHRRDYVFLTHGELRGLADEAGPWRVFVLLLGYTGLRWGEATALRACDIDLGRRRIDVHRAFSDVGGHVVLGTPKSHQSRTVPVPPFLARELAAALDGKQPDDLAFIVPASITTTLDLCGHLYPGDMDRYADRLGDAAEAADPAKIRPDEPDGDPGAEDSGR
jgi:integrase